MKETPYYCSRCGEAMPLMTLSTLCQGCLDDELGRQLGRHHRAIARLQEQKYGQSTREHWRYTFAGQFATAYVARRGTLDFNATDFVQLADLLLAELEKGEV